MCLVDWGEGIDSLQLHRENLRNEQIQSSFTYVDSFIVYGNLHLPFKRDVPVADLDAERLLIAFWV